MSNNGSGQFIIGGVADIIIPLIPPNAICDIDHIIGNDLSVNASGDLSIVAGPERGRQRVLRRLLTAPLDYVWEPDYGSGLPEMVGTVANAPAIRGNVRAQLAKEDAVAFDPSANIEVYVSDNGFVILNIQYADSDTKQTQTVNVRRESAL